MASVKETAQRNTTLLQDSLNGIFLAIGNAYYEANMALKATKGQSPASLFLDPEAQIKHNKAAFLDSLDQLEILALRATEVLERRARLRQRDAPFLVDADADANGNGATHTQGSSPETALINGKPLSTHMELEKEVPEVPDINQDVQPLTAAPDTNGATVDATEPVDSTKSVQEGVPELQVNGDSVPELQNDATTDLFGSTDAAGMDNLSTQFANADDIMNLDGPIDFGMGDMSFENFNFDDPTHFDFGSMIED